MDLLGKNVEVNSFLNGIKTEGGIFAMSRPLSSEKLNIFFNEMLYVDLV